MLGPNGGQTEEVRVLNRMIRLDKTELKYEADWRHVERIITELGLRTCKSLLKPHVQDSVSVTKAKIIERAETDDRPQVVV